MDHALTKDIFYQLLSENYNYYFLENRIKKALQKDLRCVVFSSSYGLHSILDYNIPWMSNLSGTSQDLFCHLHLAALIQEYREKLHLPKIQDFVFLLGYYALFDDLSLHRSSQDYIYRIYAPFLPNLHHYPMEKQEHPYSPWDSIEKKYGFLAEEDRNHMEQLIQEFFQNQTFFSTFYTRADNCEQRYQHLDWTSASSVEKTNYALDRAKRHNQLLRHPETALENEALLEHSLLNFYEKGIRCHILIAPFTPFYNQALSKDLKDSIPQFFSSKPELTKDSSLFHYWDSNPEFSNFLEEKQGFFDMDHLNDLGATFFTKELLHFLDAC